MNKGEALRMTLGFQVRDARRDTCVFLGREDCGGSEAEGKRKSSVWTCKIRNDH